MDSDRCEQMVKEAQIEAARHAKAEALADVAEALADHDYAAAVIATSTWDDQMWNFAAMLADVRPPSPVTRHLVSGALVRRARTFRAVSRRRRHQTLIG